MGRNITCKQTDRSVAERSPHLFVPAGKLCALRRRLSALR